MKAIAPHPPRERRCGGAFVLRAGARLQRVVPAPDACGARARARVASIAEAKPTSCH